MCFLNVSDKLIAKSKAWYCILHKPTLLGCKNREKSH